jgi:hypothetical protein
MEKDPDYLEKQKRCLKRKKKLECQNKEVDDSKFFDPEGLPI